MGRLQREVEASYIRRLGVARWRDHQRSIEGFWAEIRRRIAEMDLHHDRLRLYQDGLPVCDHEERIVRELAAQGSLNHRLVADLIDRGARLMGTESPQLLLEEYQLNRRILGVDQRAPGPSIRPDEVRREAARLLEARDRFVADRIVETLRPGETGLVFLGMLHSLEGRLPPDIECTILRPRPGESVASP